MTDYWMGCAGGPYRSRAAAFSVVSRSRAKKRCTVTKNTGTISSTRTTTAIMPPITHDDEDTPFGCAARQQQQYYQAVLPLAVLIREGERSNPSPACVDNDGYPAAFILKWLTPHSVPSA